VEDVLEAGDVFVLNWGLHFLERGAYQTATESVFKRLRPYADRKVIIWRETSAQHHRNDGGEYVQGRLRLVTR
jgi:hypothetical protein